MAITPRHIEAAANGGLDALVDLVAEAGPQLRLLIAAHLDNPHVIEPIENRIWAIAISQFSHYVESEDPNTWLLRQAVNPVRTHLLAADKRAVAQHDTLTHQKIHSCLEAINSGQEQDVVTLPELIAALDDNMRTMLEQRYQHGHSLTKLAAEIPGGTSRAASLLMAARAACDWTGIAQPPTPGELIMPSLIEEWLGGRIDPASHELLVQKTAIDLDRATQLQRQMRVHMALCAYYSAYDAQMIARRASKSDTEKNIIIGPSPDERQSGSSARNKVARSSTNSGSGMRRVRSSERRKKSSAVYVAELPEHKSSSWPLILAGVFLGLGLLGVVVLSMSIWRKPISDTQPAVSPSSTDELPQGNKSEMRNTDAPISQPPLRVSLATVANKEAMTVGDMVPLQAIVSDDKRIKQVEFYHGSQRIAVSNNAPWQASWQATAGNAVITAQVIDVDGNRVDSSSLTLSIKETPVETVQAASQDSVLIWDGENAGRDLLIPGDMKSVADAGRTGAGLSMSFTLKAVRPWMLLKSPIPDGTGLNIVGFKALSFSFRFRGGPPLIMSDVRFSSATSEPGLNQYRLQFHDMIKDLEENTWKTITVLLDTEAMVKTKMNPNEVVAFGFVFSNGEKSDFITIDIDDIKLLRSVP